MFTFERLSQYMLFACLLLMQMSEMERQSEVKYRAVSRGDRH